MADKAPPKRWMSALLTLLFGAGVGHLYAGLVTRGLVIAVLLSVLAVSAMGSLILLPSFAAWFGPFLLLCAWLWAPWDAWRRTESVQAATHPLRRWLQAGVLAAFFWVVAFPGSRSFVRTFTVTSLSMSPTIEAGDRIVVSAFDRTTVGHRDIVAFRNPDDGNYLISRIVGLPGDTLAMSGWTLALNGSRIEEAGTLVSDSTTEAHPWMEWQREHLLSSMPPTDYSPNSHTWGPLVVPPGTFFTLGDHRNMSLDSRYRGVAPLESVIGRVRRVFWSRDPETGGIRWTRAGRKID